MAVATADIEYALAYDRDRRFRLLIVPALFEEGNKLRKLTVDMVKRLDHGGVDCFLPDLPGMNESLVPLREQSVTSWREAMKRHMDAFRPTHQLAIRGGAICARPRGQGWRYAPTTGSNALRSLLRARIIASRESGIAETSEGLMEIGREHGLELGGYNLGPQMIRQLEQFGNPSNQQLRNISQPVVGGAGMWLRSEPQANIKQSHALADYILMALKR